jgi:hypothetical protein
LKFRIYNLENHKSEMEVGGPSAPLRRTDPYYFLAYF